MPKDYKVIVDESQFGMNEPTARVPWGRLAMRVKQRDRCRLTHDNYQACRAKHP